ncbi:hypothetical protein IJZ97_02465 [bacterium]|nr:hypothetical protein [bacterium]
MEIKPVSNADIGKTILNLDKILPENNPSIFMQQQNSKDSTFDNDFLFKQLYT